MDFCSNPGISKVKPADIESLWNNITSEDVVSTFMKGSEPKSSNWPIVMFLGFIFAGPYLMWKLIRSLNLDPQQKGKMRHLCVISVRKIFEFLNLKFIALR